MCAHECNDCWSRREFLTAATVSAVTALLAGCGDGQIGPSAPVLSPNGGGSLTIRLADYPELARDGGIARVNGSAVPMAVVRINASNYRVLSLVCPHQGATVNVQAGAFQCPSHGARFSADGTWVGGQQTTSLVVIPSTLDAGAGTLTINGAAGPQTQNSQQMIVVRLADYPALANNGGIARINGTSTPIAVVRINATSYRALSLVCPHQGATVNVQTGGFLCPSHGARFSTDGTWVGGQSTTSLVVIPSTLDAAAGTLTINATGVKQPKGGDDDDDD